MDPEFVLQVLGLVAIVVSLSLFIFDGFGAEIFAVTVLGIVAIVAPDALKTLLRVVRRRP